MNGFYMEGGLVRDMDLMYSKDGKPIGKFSVACTTGYGDYEKTGYYDCVLFGKRAESLSQYLKKGQQVLVKGEFSHDRWEKDGQKRSKVVFRADDIKLIGKKNSTPQQQTTAEPFEDSIPF